MTNTHPFAGHYAEGADAADAAEQSAADEAPTTAQVIGEFNAELIAAKVPEYARQFALEQAIAAYFQRSSVILAKKADA